MFKLFKKKKKIKSIPVVNYPKVKVRVVLALNRINNKYNAFTFTEDDKEFFYKKEDLPVLQNWEIFKIVRDKTYDMGVR